VTRRSSPTVFADTPMSLSASTCIESGKPPSATWSAATLLGLHRIWASSCPVRCLLRKILAETATQPLRNVGARHHLGKPGDRSRVAHRGRGFRSYAAWLCKCAGLRSKLIISRPKRLTFREGFVRSFGFSERRRETSLFTSGQTASRERLSCTTNATLVACVVFFHKPLR
jgi:hypothetical protein